MFSFLRVQDVRGGERKKEGVTGGFYLFLLGWAAQ
jgi:hypothetical protein